ncbi:MAG: Rap1a/Tai family immunity protein [Gammaproteobacteria bacterium]|jgi:hypothetical protein
MKTISVILLLFIFSGKVFAAPSGKDLLAACEIALQQGFQGATGMMCEWYVTPCDCHNGKNSEVPRVCLPEEIETEYLAKQVVSGLKARPELLTKKAEISAGEILREKYPCD